MGLRDRIEREVRAAWRQAARRGQETNVNQVRRVNAVIVGNTGGGTAGASTHQSAPIVQRPANVSDEPSSSDSS